MTDLQVDVAIVGAGTAGIAAYRAARSAGATAVLIEGGADGTTCARVGCMPSKLLVAAAASAHAVRSAPGFGVHAVGGVRIDGRAVMDRVRRERDRFVALVLRDLERMPASDRLHGRATFIDDHALDVGGHTRVAARSIVIATGARPTIDAAHASLGDRAVVSDDIFDWQDLPRSVAVIGAGIVGLELGQALHRLGVRVAVLGRGGRVGPLGDPAVAAYATDAFNREFTFEPDAGGVDMHRDGERIAIHRTSCDGDRCDEHFDFVLVATGRAPNVHGIGLENTSVRLDPKGVPLYDRSTGEAQTATRSAAAGSGIFVAGDAGNVIPLLHEATDEGRIAGHNAARASLGKAVDRNARRVPLHVVFTDPQIGIVGDGFTTLPPGTFVAGEASFEDQGRARILLRNSGLVRMYAETATGRFLGAELFAPDGEHLAHLLAWALQNGQTVGEMLAMPYYHPVVEEALRTALQDADAALRAAHRADAGTARTGGREFRWM